MKIVSAESAVRRYSSRQNDEAKEKGVTQWETKAGKRIRTRGQKQKIAKKGQMEKKKQDKQPKRKP